MNHDWLTHSLASHDGLAWLGREWLLTNGAGGFAMGSASGLNTRRYHALLIASAKPPVARVAVLNQVLEQLIITVAGRDHTIDLTSCGFRGDDGALLTSPRGHERQRRFERGLAVAWTFDASPTPHARTAPAGPTVTRELSLHWKSQACTIRYRVEGLAALGASGARLRLAPMVTLRDFHALLHKDAAGAFTVSVAEQGVTVTRDGIAATFHCPGAAFARGREWWHRLHYPCDLERGQEHQEDHFMPGAFEAALPVGDTAPAEVVLTAALGSIAAAPEAGSPRLPHLEMIERHLASGRGVVEAGARGADGREAATLANPRLRKALALASDDFIVDRVFQGKTLATVIAGYPWFADWGRDTFIALPGLLLETGRFAEARDTLRVFAASIQDGLVPNRFDDYDDQAAHYNTVDASLWFIRAALQYAEMSGDAASWGEWLEPAVEQVVHSYIRGTRHGIQMAGDGLITAGGHDTQLTWMDAAALNDRGQSVVFTPRAGKAVEINALWHDCLVRLSLKATRKDFAQHCERIAGRVKRSYARVFWNEGLGHAHDHVRTIASVGVEGDAEAGVADASLRPNQVFAASVEHSPLPATRCRDILEVVRDRLLTPFGLRTLAEGDSNYHPFYTGPAFQRDEAYHQGTVWPWLIGPYAEAVLRLGKFKEPARAQARAAVAPLVDWMLGDGLGQLHEIHEAAPPHRGVGCPAQAWSVAELLRILRLIES